MSNVKLGIRVRPFTERELKSDSGKVSVISVVDSTSVTITNVKVNTSGAGDSRERVRRYTADYTFNSSCPPHDEKYADQEKVFETIGSEVLSLFSTGVSACVLAYGQSATGKTYTMMGTETEPGLVPRICRQLAERTSVITVSFLEIYNERVHDLLAGEEVPDHCSSLPRIRGNTRKDLKVREHPVRGTYVQNLRRVVVEDIETLLALLKEGASRRRTAATRRNTSSSRSHAILELSADTATVHLADLAGSEKASWEGCGGGRQKEGANINKSLVALSNVISALVTVGSGRGRFVPYRDSALTWLLKDCFTGGAKTFIIATLSPSASCYGESASTLRWAARAKHLPLSRAIGNQQLTTRAILQSQLTRLLAELTKHYIKYLPEKGTIVYDGNHWETEENKYFVKNYISDTELRVIEEEQDSIGNIMKPKTKPNSHTSESTPSSIASVSSEVINIGGKEVNLTHEVNKEIDKLFAPSLERTRSGCDLKVLAPHRNKKPQYRSQEVLSISTQKPLRCPNSSVPTGNSKDQTTFENNDLQIRCEEVANVTATTSKMESKESLHVPLSYDNEQRAEIVASVTERLYTKLKDRENTVSKIESVVDKKIIEPLSELRICTNARQRLMELSKRAMKTRRRIGIPAHTQTKKQVIRVKDQAVDIQTDLEPYYIKERNVYTAHHDMGTETANMTPRCKDVAVGSKYGSINQKEISTETENKIITFKTVFAMTDDLIKSERCTQTSVPIVPPRRKRKNPIYVRETEDTSDGDETQSVEFVSTPIININISHKRESDSDSHPSDENTDCNLSSAPSGGMPPDLITNHRNVEMVDYIEVPNIIDSNEPFSKITDHTSAHIVNEFSPDAEIPLPKTTMHTSVDSIKKSMEDVILGLNKEMYPYNIVLSPPAEREHYKSKVKFKEDANITAPQKPSLQSWWQWQNITKKEPKHNVEPKPTERNESATSSDSDERIPLPTFRNLKSPHVLYKPVYIPHINTNKQYRSAKTKIYRDFLGLDKEISDQYERHKNSDYDSDYKEDFRRKKQYFEMKFDKEYFSTKDTFFKAQKNLLSSCDRLERSIDNYDCYLAKSGYCSSRCSDTSTVESPREYLQRLVRLRRDTVNYNYNKEANFSPNRLKDLGY